MSNVYMFLEYFLFQFNAKTIGQYSKGKEYKNIESSNSGVFSYVSLPIILVCRKN